MLLRSESTAFNSVVLILLALSLIVGFVLISAPSDPLSSLVQDGLEEQDLGRTKESDQDDENGASGGVRKGQTIFPSGAPVVAPPTIEATRAPVRTGQKKGRPPLKTAFTPPLSLNATNPKVLNPTDNAGNALPKCEDERFTIREPLGRYHERGYTGTVSTCLEQLDDTDADLVCTALNNGVFAASYEPDGSRVCRCGGIPLWNGLCVLATSVTYTYDDKYVEDFKDLSKVCTSTTVWEDGTFADGRYYGPNCTVLDLNPRSVVRRFPNKLFFMDGDSHQQDKIWGFIAEMRNQRLHAVPDYGDKWGKDIRFEVSEFKDLFELHYFGELSFTEDLRKCRTTTNPTEPCTVFIYRFDRFGSDYQNSANSLMAHPPDYVIAAFISQTYSNGMDPQMETKKVWEDVFTQRASQNQPISFAWTAYPMITSFIATNMTEWIETLSRFQSVKHHFAILDSRLYSIFNKKTPKEPGFLTLQATWHDNCHYQAKANAKTGRFDIVAAAELCVAPVTKLLYRAMLSVFSLPTK